MNLRSKLLLCVVPALLIVAVAGWLALRASEANMLAFETLAQRSQILLLSLQSAERNARVIIEESQKFQSRSVNTSLASAALDALIEDLNTYSSIRGQYGESMPSAAQMLELGLKLETHWRSSARNSFADNQIRPVGNLARQLEGLLKAAKNLAQESLAFERAALGDSVRSFQNIYKIVLLISLCLALALALLVARTIEGPVQALEQASIRLSKGELGAQIDLLPGGELGTLIKAYNQMSRSLKDSTLSRDYVQTLLDATPSLVVVVNSEGQICFLNAKAREASWQEVGVGSTLFSQAFRFESPFTDSADHSEVLAYMETVDQRKIPMLISSRRISDAERVLVLTDISNYERDREERQVLLSELYHAEQLASLGAMSAEVSHRLNQPLTSIQLFLQQARREASRDKDVEKLTGLLSDAIEEASRASTTVKDILKATRRPLRVMEADVDLIKLVKDTFTLFKSGSLAARVSFSLDSSIAHCRVPGSPEELKEALFVLIQNAVQASAPDQVAHVIVRLTPDADRVRVEIEDNCGGIPEGMEQKIFETFFTTKPSGKGTGLGLSIAQRILRNHETQLLLENMPGIGANFYFFLPTKVSPRRSFREQQV